MYFDKYINNQHILVNKQQAQILVNKLMNTHNKHKYEVNIVLP